MMRMTSPQVIECDCGRCVVERSEDVYRVTGPMYHLRDSASEWLVCPHCEDRIKIHPVVDWADASEPKGGLK